MLKRLTALLLLVSMQVLPAHAQYTANQAVPSITYNSVRYPHDWTEGTGTLGASGEIDIPSPIAGNTQRRWIYVQNQSAATITLEYESRLANGTTAAFPKILLAPGAAAGSQGSSDERGFAAFVPQGIVKVLGAANAPVTILEVVE